MMEITIDLANKRIAESAYGLIKYSWQLDIGRVFAENTTMQTVVLSFISYDDTNIRHPLTFKGVFC